MRCELPGVPGWEGGGGLQGRQGRVQMSTAFPCLQAYSCPGIWGFGFPSLMHASLQRAASTPGSLRSVTDPTLKKGEGRATVGRTLNLGSENLGPRCLFELGSNTESLRASVIPSVQ